LGSLGLSSGTISVVSRFVGAGEHDRADLAIKQSFWLALSITIPLTLVTYFEAEAMVGLLTDAPRTIALGGTYLRIVMLSVSFRFWSMIAARALQGAGDTRWPLYGTLLGTLVRLPIAALAHPATLTLSVAGWTVAPASGSASVPSTPRCWVISTSARASTCFGFGPGNGRRSRRAPASVPAATDSPFAR
jgi:Na+-driven multidrug efflux pump